MNEYFNLLNDRIPEIISRDQFIDRIFEYNRLISSNINLNNIVSSIDLTDRIINGEIIKIKNDNYYPDELIPNYSSELAAIMLKLFTKLNNHEDFKISSRNLVVRFNNRAIIRMEWQICFWVDFKFPSHQLTTFINFIVPEYQLKKTFLNLIIILVRNNMLSINPFTIFLGIKILIDRKKLRKL